MFLMREDKIQGQVGGGWALEIESFGPFEIASNQLASACHLGARKLGKVRVT